MVRKLTIGRNDGCASKAWRRPPPAISILPSLYRTGHLAASLARDLFEELTEVGEGMLMAELIRKDNQTPAELARALGVRRPTITASIARARQFGLLTQERSVEDRRSSHISLTPHGRAVAGIVAARMASVEARIRLRLEAGDEQALCRIVAAVARERCVDGDTG